MTKVGIFCGIIFGYTTLFLLSGCGAVPDPFDKSEEVAEDKITFDDVYNRMVDGFLHEGQYIVSRSPQGPENRGEAVLWTGLAAGYLPCDKARPFMAFLAAMSIKNGGYFERYKPLGEEYNYRPINFDGMSGIYFGYAGYLAKCGETGDVRRSWEFHKKFLHEYRGRLHPTVNDVYPVPFDSVRQAIDWKLDLRSTAPSNTALGLASTAATGWVASVVASKSACYRIHLAYLQLKALDLLGVHTGRNSFCKATGKIGKPEETAIDIPIIDHFCGRPGLKEYLDSFKFNEWEMRNQRCGLWETPDGQGYETPGLDYLTAYSEIYGSN